MVMGGMLRGLGDERSGVGILESMEKTCSVLPVDATECKNYINVYGNIILQLVEENLTPSEICTAVGLC